MNFSDLNKFLNPIKRKIFLLVGKSLLTAINNSGEVGFYSSGARSNPQRVSTEWFGNLTDIERSQPYGFETYPIIGTSKSVIVCPDGIRSNAFAIMVQDDEYRPTDLSSGDICLYNANGVKIVLENATNKLKVTASGDAEFTVPNLKVTGNIEADGFISAKGKVIADDEATAVSLHEHYHIGNLGYNTNIPIPGSGAGSVPIPANKPTYDSADQTVDFETVGIKNVGTMSQNVEAHTHTQPNDGGGDAESPTNAPA